MTFFTIPIWAVDIFGSLMMVVLSIGSLNLVRHEKKRDPENVIWTWLLWVTFAMTLFTVSRSCGHIIKQFLIMTERSDIWKVLSPVSGGVNTFTFIVVASVTLYFQRTWSIYESISNDKKALQEAKDELIYVNHNLEHLITQRTRELAQSEHKYRRIFELSKDMILVTEKDGTILDINPSGYKMLGLLKKEESLINRSFSDFLKKPSDWNGILYGMEPEGFISNAEIDLLRNDGATIRTLVTGNLNREDDTNKDTIHFVIKDIERKRLMEQQMAQADKLASIGEFSAGIAHEINNPLGIILGYTQLLKRKEEVNSQNYEDLKTIEKHVQHCKSIVSDLLNFARGSTPVKDAVNVNEIMDEVLNFIKKHAKMDHVNFVTSYDPEIMPLYLDEKKIRQVLINLIMNAVHAVGRQGAITLITTNCKSKKCAYVKIRDDGCGIEKKHLSRIFDPFFTTKPTGEGTGLGLSVSYGIIKNHGGDILVDSEPGKGTEFTVVLPHEYTEKVQKDPDRNEKK